MILHNKGDKRAYDLSAILLLQEQHGYDGNHNEHGYKQYLWSSVLIMPADLYVVDNNTPIDEDLKHHIYALSLHHIFYLAH